MAKFDKVIPPGQEGKIEIAVDGTKVHGYWTKGATVYTNDPVNRQISISLSAREVPYVHVQPEGTVFLHGRYGEAVERKVHLKSNEKDLDFQVTGVTSNIDDKITYSYSPTGTPGEYSLSVFKNPYLPTQSTYGNVFVHTNSKRLARADIQVSVMAKGEISVSPILLNFGQVRFGDNVAEGESVTKSVMLSKPTGEFGITAIELNNASFEAVRETVTPGRQYRVLVTFRPPMKRAGRDSESAEMIIHTNDPLEPAIRVQVIARAM